MANQAYFPDQFSYTTYDIASIPYGMRRHTQLLPHLFQTKLLTHLPILRSIPFVMSWSTLRLPHLYQTTFLIHFPMLSDILYRLMLRMLLLPHFFQAKFLTHLPILANILYGINNMGYQLLVMDRYRTYPLIHFGVLSIIWEDCLRLLVIICFFY